MTIDGIKVNCFADVDGIPIKNHLPLELRERLKTENQWLEDGYIVKATAVPYDMHPSVLSKRTFTYYLDEDVEVIAPENAPRNCLTCSIQKGRFCAVAGDYVSSKHCCSEWTS